MEHVQLKPGFGCKGMMEVTDKGPLAPAHGWAPLVPLQPPALHCVWGAHSLHDHRQVPLLVPRRKKHAPWNLG